MTMNEATDVPVARHPAAGEPPESYFVPPADVFETTDELVLVTDMPGVKPDGLDVTIEENVLAIRGRPKVKEDPAGQSLLQEFAVGEYYRAFQLPADFDSQKTRASLKQGVLTLRIPKSERLKPRRIEVKEE
jgi:HSP20 family molecular chaperone IbpA